MEKSISRRDFLKNLALAGVSISSLAGCAVSKDASPPVSVDDGKSKVILVRSDSLTQAGSPDQAVVRRMLDAAVPQALGVASADAAWRMLFKPNDTVGIKVNCIASRIPSSPQLAYAIADSLTAAGVPAEQIIIWDREDRELALSGYTINMDGPGVRCYGTKPGVGYGKELIKARSVGSRLSKILSRQCTATVNVPVLKDHNIAGFTLGLKNYFGAIENPNKFHGNNCDPYVADLYMAPQIREKNKLVICDAINVLYEGGPTSYNPRYTWRYNGLIIGTDPVAVDQIGLMLLEEKRATEGLPMLASIGRPAKYVATAADPDHLLGVADPEKIRVLEINIV
ncbi:DUF362 domain-containing protein [Candidatus Poribacteria bacterium]